MEKKKADMTAQKHLVFNSSFRLILEQLLQLMSPLRLLDV